MSYLSYTFFMLADVIPTEWSNKRQRTTYGHFSDKKCIYGNVYKYCTWRGTVLFLMKVNVSAHIWQMLQLKFSYHTHTGNMLSCHLLDVRNCVLINCDYFCVDGFLHSKSENSILASASDLRISTNLPMLFTSNSIHIQLVHTVYI